jgi:uncharacterized membrane protein YcfT
MNATADRIDGPARVAWVDYARGLCIVLVVMMHSTLGVEAAAGSEGWLHHAAAFAKPFRIPAFFLISGLLFAHVADRNWRGFLDSKVLHFAYFYVLWLTIQFLFRAPAGIASQGVAQQVHDYLLAFVDPFGPLWFIYMLPVFYVVTRLSRGIPALAILAAAACLEALHVQTGWTLIDEFCARFVYFYSGFVFSQLIFRHAAQVPAHRGLALFALAAWAFTNAFAVHLGWSEWPGISLALGLLGAAAIVVAAVLLADASLLPAIRAIGRNTLPVYVAFTIPMAIARTVLLKAGVILDIGTVSLLVTIAALIVPLALAFLVRGTRLAFLFERPAWCRLTGTLRLAKAHR